MAEKDYYKILGVGRTSSPAEIKQAYRRLALEHHPDKAGKAGEARFKEANEAYQVLSDPKKRAQYDQFGAGGGFGGGRPGAGRPPGGGFGGGGFEDIFSGSGFGFGRSSGGGFGTMGDIFEDMFGAALSQLTVEAPISFTQAILGAQLQFKTQQGDIINLKIPAGTRDGEAFLFRGKGMPHRRGRGDLTVIVRVKLPEKLTPEQRALFEKLREAGL